MKIIKTYSFQLNLVKPKHLYARFYKTSEPNMCFYYLLFLEIGIETYNL